MHLLLSPAPTAVAVHLFDIDSTTAGWFRERLSPSFADVLFWLSGPGCEVWVTTVLLIAAGYMIWRKHWHALSMLMLTVPGGDTARSL